MRKEITLFIMSNTGGRPRQWTVSALFIGCLCLLTLAAAVWLGSLIHEYHQLKALVPENQRLREQITAQRSRMTDQQAHIRRFAADIDDLKERLVALNGFEHKIRLLANLDTPDNSRSYLGIGGAMPSDLDPAAAITEKQSALIREMHGQVDHLREAAAVQKSDLRYLMKGVVEKQNFLAATPSIHPLKEGWVTSNFGNRTSPFTGLREFHTGLDVGAAEGTPVLAPGDGTVTFSGTKGLYGKTIIIHHGHGMATRYAHLSKFLKKRGEKVKRGDPIGLVGQSGRSTGPHLHYEVRINGTAVDPRDYILN
jgi:murein DD-endopeptidase MepM/ murein hydrolase activator NlpD